MSRHLLLALLLLPPACASPPPREASPDVLALIEEGKTPSVIDKGLGDDVKAAPLPEGLEEYRIGAKDVLDVRVPGMADFGGDLTRADADAFGYEVMRDGRVYLPLVGAVPVAGLTPVEVQKDLSERFQRFQDAPLVSVRVLRYRSQKFLVLGGVEKPGTFPVDGSTTLLEAVALAEGVRDGADLERAYVLRKERLLPVSLGDMLLRGDTRRNVVLRDGDVVFVPPEIRQEVYVLGEVRQPGRVPISPYRPLTVVAALAEAEGLDRLHAKRDEIVIFRGSWQEPRSFTLTEGDVSRFGAHILLKPGDVVHVGPRGLANWSRTLSLLLPWATSVTSTALAAIAVAQD
ncbi:MAG: polysaccharide biosynthesis/export family protein [Planctomycetes bacterium]|nr:polysaccharide biosynthesis/export family protein [Planctomycetota bacterium]